MNDHTELERRLRDTLVARAEHVQPSPDLWDRVADATTRRSRWARPGAWLAAAGVAALLIAALVIIPNLLRDPVPFDIVETPPSSSATDAPLPIPVDAPGAAALVAFREGPNDNGGSGAVLDLDPVTGEFRDTLFEGQPERDTPFTVSMDLQPGTGRLAQVGSIEGRWEVWVGLPDGPGYVQFGAGEQRVSQDGNDRRPAVRWTQDGELLLWAGQARDGSDDTWLFALDLSRVDGTRELPAEDLVLSSFQPPGWGVPDVRLLDVVGTRGSELSVRAAKGGEALGALLVPREGCAPGIDSACVYEIAETSIASRGPLLVAEADAGLNPGQLVGPGYKLMVEDDGPLVLSYAGDGDVSGELALPDELLAMTGDPLDTWMDAAGSTVVVGRGDRAWILEVSIDSDNPEVVSTVEIPGGASAAAVVIDPGTDEGRATGDLRAEVTTITISPAGNPVDVDGVKLVGGQAARSGVLADVNASLQAQTDRALVQWDRDIAANDPADSEYIRRATTTLLTPTPTILSVEWEQSSSMGFLGFRGFDSIVFDLTTGRRLDLDDVVVDPADPRFLDVVQRAIGREVGPAALDDGGQAMDDVLAFMSVFSIDDQSFTLLFPETVEGASASFDPIRATVPADDVLEFLAPGVVRDHLANTPDANGEVKEETESAVAEVLTPEVTVVADDDGRLTIIDAAGADTSVDRPSGVDMDASLGAVVVRPGVDDAEVLTTWCLGDGCTRARTLVRKGEVVVNDRLQPESQDLQVGGNNQITDTTPAFDALGRFAVWSEFDGDGYRLVVQRWEEEPSTNRILIPVPAQNGVVPDGVAGITRLEDGSLRIHTGAYEPAPSAASAAGQFVIDVPLNNSGNPEPSGATIEYQTLPGVLVGSATTTESPGSVVGIVAVDDALLQIDLGGPRYSSGRGPFPVGYGPDQLDRVVGITYYGGLVVRLRDGTFRETGIRFEPFEEGTFIVDLPADTVAVNGFPPPG